MRKKVFHFLSLFLFVLFHPQKGGAGDFNPDAIGDRLNLLANISRGPFTQNCGEAVLEFRGCPFVFRQLQEDKEHGFLKNLFESSPGDAPVEICRGQVENNGGDLWNPQELEAELSRLSTTSLGLKQNYFSEKINHCYNPDVWSENPNDIKYEQNTIISMAYKYLNRTKRGNEQNFIELTNLNSLLGVDLASGINCNRFVTSPDASLCAQMKDQDCKPQGGLAQLSESLRTNAIEPLLALKMKLNSLRRSRSQRTKGQREKIKASIELIKQTYPILIGNEMEDFLREEVYDKGKLPSLTRVQSALKKQLENNRDATAKRIEDNNELNRCLIYGHEDDCGDFYEKLNKNPPHDVAYLYNQQDHNQRKTQSNFESELLPKMRGSSFYYNSVECLDDFREIKTGVNNLVFDTGVNIGLTIATAGAGAIVGLGRAAFITARAATLTADALFLGTGVKETIDICKNSFNQIVGDSHYQSQGRFQCPKGPQETNFNAVDDLRACITAAVLTPIDALPFTPAILRQLRRTNIPKDRLGNLLEEPLFRRCQRGGQGATCTEFIEENRNHFKEVASSCLNPEFARARAQACRAIEDFMSRNPVLRLSDLIPKEKQGRSVVVEFSGDRGHVTLRYMMETTDEAGNTVMKSLSQDGSSFLFPRRINERWFQGSKRTDELGDMDKYVPGSHYIIDATPEQLETLLKVQQRGGFSRACTHDARRALSEAGIIEMPRGLTAPYRKVSIRSMVNDLTEKFGPPDQNTTRAIQEFLDPKKAGFSDEQWRNFLVTEAGWGVLSPLAVFGLYPSLVPLGTTAGLTAADTILTLTGENGDLTYITLEKLREVYTAYLDDHNIPISN